MPRDKSVRTRRRIVDATAQVLLTHGYGGTRLADVAEIAGVRVPSIYHHFASRDELIGEAVSLGLEQARGRVVDALDALPPETPSIERLDVAVTAHLGTLLTHSAHLAAAVRTAPQLPEPMRQRQRAAGRAYLDVWRDLVDRAQAAGDIDPELDPGVALMVLAGALNWTPQWWDPERGSLDGVIVAARRMLRDGFSLRG